MKSTISKRTYKAIYRLLDRVSPIEGDCGCLCGAACCTCSYEPEDLEFTADGDENADNYMGIYLLPGEEKIHDQKDSDWIEWGFIRAEDYEFPDSWHGKVGFIQCKHAPQCPRKSRPIQCRTFPLAPYFDENGVFHVIMNVDDLPYICPLIEDDIELTDRFVQATYTAWKHLIRDPLIADLVMMDSDFINEDEAKVMK
ncbi:MAG: hypothetical protein Q4D99_02975 [Bacillota bacterium]|nr:hypothetical protein [Bacillota bacterium]